LDAGESPGLTFGKLWLNQQITNKSATQVHATLATWYDEIIVGTQKIPDAVATGYPAWRVAMPVGQFSDIPNTSLLGGYVWPTPYTVPPGQFRNQARIIDGYSGFVRVGTKMYSMAAGGHDAWQN